MLLSFMEVMDTELVWDMLVLAMVLDLTLLVLSMLPSVRLRLSQRLKLMLVFCMEPMDMVPVLDAGLGYGYSGLGYAGYGGYGLGYGRLGYAGLGYYGKRSADAEPEADAGLYYG